MDDANPIERLFGHVTGLQIMQTVLAVQHIRSLKPEDRPGHIEWIKQSLEAAFAGLTVTGDHAASPATITAEARKVCAAMLRNIDGMAEG